MTLGRESAASSRAAHAFVAGLIAHGVRDFVVSPGSRSQALTLAVVAAQRQGAARVHVRIDERVAGFVALGLARETRAPVAMICTSGTATAGFLPATMEAFHSGVPLLVLTADRPPELRGVGANQATAQVGMFDAWTRWSIDAPTPGEQSVDWQQLARYAVNAAVGADTAGAEAVARSIRGIDVVAGVRGRAGVAGPVHVNLPYREPLSSDTVAPNYVPGAVPPTVERGATLVSAGLRTVLVAGDGAGAEAVELAEAAGWPLLAEAVSAARYGATVITRYRQLLRTPQLRNRIERVVVMGHPTLTREVAALISDPAVQVISVPRGGEAVNLGHDARIESRIAVEHTRAPDAAWLQQWLDAEHALAHPPQKPADDAAPIDRPTLVNAVWQATGANDRLMVGSSRLVRVLDDTAPARRVRVHANRGLAGIDGIIATGIGIGIGAGAGAGAGAAPTAGHQRLTGVTRVLLGDVSALHDTGALLLPRDEPEPCLQIVIGNDGGGTIFDALEVAATAPAADFDRAFYTPHHADLAALAQGYGWHYIAVRTNAELRAALALAAAPEAPRRSIIDVQLPR
ncbi:2-succinyl-5-enolpyruvyl-6-hydroxy-3-cyclohexene-1-carboxylic-acid synthase [Microbacterium sp. YY-01]|uniref:2-succinyl-5-enolpyruvyl-6-hydroxy-3- cyclohexene-1-carboxylic-acid synthase n=1 Tax=Microbacterium sp. YY-01 TaxID=3421634 RepID=UPI003D186710